MLQIKTIRTRLDNAEAFDAEVNAALAEGWTLTKREVLQPLAQPKDGAYTHNLLYAEMEREVITEAERCCENCAYFGESAAAEPCLSCDDDCSNWSAR